MAYKLVCTHELHGFKKGAEITDPDEVERRLASHHHFFTKVWIPDPVPAPEPAPTTSSAAVNAIGASTTTSAPAA